MGRFVLPISSTSRKPLVTSIQTSAPLPSMMAFVPIVTPWTKRSIAAMSSFRAVRTPMTPRVGSSGVEGTFAKANARVVSS